MAKPRALLRVAAVAATAAAARADGVDWLTDAERGRLSGLRASSRRDSFLAGHWLARRLAARWLGVPPARVALAAFADGRPALRLDGAPLPLSLSIAHSDDWLALALGEVALGVDVEVPPNGRERDLSALARFAFAAPETRTLAALEGSRRAAEFHALWALKEAWVKRSGEGLRPRQARSIHPLACDEPLANARSWAFHAGALALATGVPVRLETKGARLPSPRCWRYAPALGAPD